MIVYERNKCERTCFCFLPRFSTHVRNDKNDKKKHVTRTCWSSATLARKVNTTVVVADATESPECPVELNVLWLTPWYLGGGMFSIFIYPDRGLSSDDGEKREFSNWAYVINFSTVCRRENTTKREF